MTHAHEKILQWPIESNRSQTNGTPAERVYHRTTYTCQNETTDEMGIFNASL